MNRDLLTIISQMSPQFSKGQRLIANYIVNHFDKAAFMTAFKLGTTVGVSESTVVRFASEVSGAAKGASGVDPQQADHCTADGCDQRSAGEWECARAGAREGY